MYWTQVVSSGGWGVGGAWTRLPGREQVGWAPTLQSETCLVVLYPPLEKTDIPFQREEGPHFPQMLHLHPHASGLVPPSHPPGPAPS